MEQHELQGLMDTPMSSAGAFDAFYEAHAVATGAIVAALRGSEVGVEDVVQETFARAFERWEQVAAMDRPDLWLHRVALNLATSRLRRLGAESRAVARLAGRAASVTAEPGPGDADFWRLVRRLPARQARVVALRYAADLPVADIAAVTGLADGTVKAHLHRARQRLGTWLEASGERDQDD